MSSYPEEQGEEVEALESIFSKEGEFVVERREPPCIFRIAISASPEEPSQNHVAAALLVDQGPKYPEESPILSIVDTKGLSEEQILELADLARSTAADMQGMVVGFSVAETVKEWLIRNNKPPSDGSMYSKMMERERRRVEESKRVEAEAVRQETIDKEFREARLAKAVTDPTDDGSLAAKARKGGGTSVTKETFLTWRRKFDLEMAEKKVADAKAAEEADASRRTQKTKKARSTGLSTEDAAEILARKSGKQLFEEGGTRLLAAEAHEIELAAARMKELEIEREAARATQETGGAQVQDASVFLEGDDDVDLDDLDDSDFEDDIDGIGDDDGDASDADVDAEGQVLGETSDAAYATRSGPG